MKPFVEARCPRCGASLRIEGYVSSGQIIGCPYCDNKVLVQIPTSPMSPPTPTRGMRTTEDISGRARVRALFPKDLEEMLTFEESGKYIVVKPRRYLGSKNFARIASIIREAGGEYVSAGKESHFRVLKE